MPDIELETRLPLPREEVWNWLRRPGTFLRINPPGLVVPELDPHNMGEGSDLKMHFQHPIQQALPLADRLTLPATMNVRKVVPGETILSGSDSWLREMRLSDAPDGTTVFYQRIWWRALNSLRPTVGRLVQFRADQAVDDLTLFNRTQFDRPQHVVISGASGVIGQQLTALLQSGGHRVTRLVRRRTRSRFETSWEPNLGLLDPEALAGADAVINLCGSPLVRRLTPEQLAEINNSRVSSTRTLVEAMRRMDTPPRVFLNASASTYYGARRPGEPLVESSAPGTSLTAAITRRWEDAARPAEDLGVRTAMMRMSTVLSANGGLLGLMLPFYVAGIGGMPAPGGQMFSWVSIDDAVSAFLHVLHDDRLRGPINVSSPDPVTFRELSRTLGRRLHRPGIMPMSRVSRAVVGDNTYDLLVDVDQKVCGERLQASGYRFRQPDIASAIDHALAV